MKKPSSIALMIGASLVLAGCATSEPAAEQEASTLCDPVSSGAASEVVQVEGEKDGEVELSFPTPLTTENSQTTIIETGEGRNFTGEARAYFEYAMYSGTTGEEILSTGFGGEQLVKFFATSEVTPNLCQALAGAPMGSSLVSVFTAQDFHNSQGNSQLGLEPEDTVVMYVELEDFAYPRATGEELPQQGGFPTVVLTPDGQPGLQPLESAAPEELRTSTLIEGPGEPIAIGDTAYVHYSGWTWDGVLFDSSWDRGEPTEFPISTQNLIEGFVQSLEGVTVGSQIITVIPPDLAYGDEGSGSIPGGSTLVFVIDVLSID